MSKTSSKPTGRKRLVIAAAALLGVVALTTAAYFTDFANVNLNGSADGTGIGGKNDFSISVAKTDVDGDLVTPRAWVSANTDTGVNYTIPGADALAPGSDATASIPIKNTSTALDATVKLKIQNIPDTDSDDEMVAALRYTITLDGAPIATNLRQSQVADLNLYTAADPFEAGDVAEIRVTVILPNQATQALNDALNGKTAYVQVHLDAQSTS